MKIENRLKLLASENSNYAPLLAQWEFDKRLLSRALNSVSNSFPHYSLHDTSHSSTIINQIEKIIAPNISYLSATDCWLILEACYWHDSGMIINHDEKMGLVKDRDFISYLTSLKNDGGDFSVDAASILNGIDKEDIEKLLGDSQSLMFIIADYYRSKHAARSEEHVNNPNKIGVDSPRTYLIPKRLISILGKICSCHGKSSDSILELQKATDGMDLEDYAHPRYVAGLLRIGDLLDIDDGRFCETLLKSISKSPRTSCAHKRKHESIKNLYIDSRVIEIKAECEDYESFSVQQAWFDYIQSEFDFQKRVWNEIVPNQDYISLPTVNNVSCEIKGYLTVKGEVPKVTLDKERIYQYLTGNLIYRNATPYLRELIQNSIDAIHNKVWEKYFLEGVGEGVNIYSCELVKLKAFNELLKNESVNISLERVGANGCKLVIRDTGLGMSIQDIGKIINVGSKNQGAKKAIVNSMPDWAKPSGYFGIGFQSVFSASDSVIIETKQDGDLCYQVNFIKNEGRLPNVGVKEIKRKWFEGTRIEMYIHEDKLDDITLLSESTRRKLYYIEADDGYVDPLITATYDSEQKLSDIKRKVRDQIESTFKSCSVNIIFNGDVIDTGSFSYDFADFNSGIEFNFDIANDKTKKLSLLYRRGVVESHNYHPFLKGAVNIFGGDASDWLSINRDGLRSDKYRVVNELIANGVKNNADKIYDASENKKIASLFLCSETAHYSDDWKEIMVNGVSLDSVYNEGSSVDFMLSNSGRENNYYEFEGAEPNPVDVICTFSSLVLKSGKVPVFSGIEDKHGYVIDKVSMRVVNDRNDVDYIIAPRLVKENIDSFAIGKTKRTAILCYSSKYDKIALEYKLAPSEIFIFGYFSFIEFDRNNHPGVLFLPNLLSGDKFEDEIDIIFDFYAKNNIVLDKGLLASLYHECWTELSICPPKKTSEESVID
ncbi:ATP-binding protein [Serratia ureilytica]|uniref:HD domain-containing protein n=1 Tax=Serratia ureilytica TaxID=300181 RepID=UPI0018D5E4F2|nr:ATP-binding protein [Serratia ureilytica]MBH3005938.1 ATP-binding protein [Serratia ureilytica]HAT3794569.1 hypothetical protein [Serratia marcescens]